MSDDEIEDPRMLGRSKGNMKSLFASDRAAASHGSQSLKYEGAKKKESVTAAPSSASGGGSGGGGGSTGTSIAAQATIQAYRGEQHMGTTAVAVVVNPQQTNVIIVDREKRPLGKVRVDAQMQLIQNPSELHYATLYDPSVQQHWTLMFKTAGDCSKFVAATLTAQHYIMLVDGPVPPFNDLAESQAPLAKKKDSVRVAYTIWLMQRVGMTSTFTVGKNIEEIPREAPKLVKLGSNNLMVGIEELLVSMGSGGRRIGFLPPKKTKVGGLGNPEVSPSDSVVVVMEVFDVEKDEGDMPSLALADDPLDGGRIGRQRSASRRGGRDLGDIDSDDDLNMTSARRSKAREPYAAKSEPEPVAPAAIAAKPETPTTAAVDTNSLLQAFLINSMQQQQAPKEPTPAPQPAAPSVDVERSIDRLHHQIASLYDKIDRIDIDSKLQKNNEALERIVKKAVGKMPISDVDVEDMAKDRDQLLAKIEQQKQRVQEMTDNYHKALETLGKHKDTTSGLKNDLLIERETSQARIKELTERRRLELVDAEVRHKRDLEAAVAKAIDETTEIEYKRGYEAGKIDALQLAGSSSTDELKQLLSTKEQEIVALQSEMSQLKSKHYEERREHDDQIQSLNSLIRRLEDRDGGERKDLMEQTTAFTKTLRRTMNATYASIEEQFYATEQDTILVADALNMVLVSVKSETREAVNALKNEAAAEQTRPHKSRKQPEPPEAYTDSKVSTQQVYGESQAREDEAIRAHTEQVLANMKEGQNEEEDFIKRYLKDREQEKAAAEGTDVLPRSVPTADEDTSAVDAPPPQVFDLPPPPMFAPPTTAVANPEETVDIDPSWLPPPPTMEEPPTAATEDVGFELDVGAMPAPPSAFAPSAEPENPVVYAPPKQEVEIDEDGKFKSAPQAEDETMGADEDLVVEGVDDEEEPEKVAPVKEKKAKRPTPKRTHFATSSDDDEGEW